MYYSFCEEATVLADAWSCCYRMINLELGHETATSDNESHRNRETPTQHNTAAAEQQLTLARNAHNTSRAMGRGSYGEVPVAGPLCVVDLVVCTLALSVDE